MWARPMLPEFGLSGRKSQRAEWLNLGGLKVASSSYGERKIARAALTETTSSDCEYSKNKQPKGAFPARNEGAISSVSLSGTNFDVDFQKVVRRPTECAAPWPAHSFTLGQVAPERFNGAFGPVLGSTLESAVCANERRTVGQSRAPQAFCNAAWWISELQLLVDARWQ